MVIRAANGAGLATFVDPKKTTETAIGFGQRGKGGKLKGGAVVKNLDGRKAAVSKELKQIIIDAVATRPEWAEVGPNGDTITVLKAAKPTKAKKATKAPAKPIEGADEPQTTPPA